MDSTSLSRYFSEGEVEKKRRTDQYAFFILTPMPPCNRNVTFQRQFHPKEAYVGTPRAEACDDTVTNLNPGNRYLLSPIKFRMVSRAVLDLFSACWIPAIYKHSLKAEHPALHAKSPPCPPNKPPPSRRPQRIAASWSRNQQIMKC